MLLYLKSLYWIRSVGIVSYMQHYILNFVFISQQSYTTGKIFLYLFDEILLIYQAGHTVYNSLQGLL